MGRDLGTTAAAAFVATIAYLPALFVGVLVGRPLPVAALLVGIAVAGLVAARTDDVWMLVPGFLGAATWLLVVYGITHHDQARWVIGDDGSGACRTIAHGWSPQFEMHDTACATTGVYDLLFWSAPAVGAVLATLLVVAWRRHRRERGGSAPGSGRLLSQAA